MLRQKPTHVLPQKLLKEATIHFYCLSDESHFSYICMIMELKELNFVNIWKTSEAVNLVFQWIFSVKHKSLHVSMWVLLRYIQKMETYFIPVIMEKQQMLQRKILSSNRGWGGGGEGSEKIKPKHWIFHG